MPECRHLLFGRTTTLLFFYLLMGCTGPLPSLKGWPEQATDTASNTSKKSTDSQMDTDHSVHSDTSSKSDISTGDSSDTVHLETDTASSSEDTAESTEFPTSKPDSSIDDSESSTSDSESSTSDSESSTSDSESSTSDSESSTNDSDRSTEDSETVELVDCIGMPDFTPCNSITGAVSPICIDETCQSPGCGNTLCNYPGINFPLPDTGQKQCYNTSNEITCPSNESDQYYGQDAQFGLDSADVDRYLRDDSASASEPMVYDQVTTLTWQGCTPGRYTRECLGKDETFSYWEARDYCASLEWANTSGWRLPSRFELLSIVDLGQTEFAFDPIAFPNPALSFPLITADTSGISGNLAFAVYFETGSMISALKDQTAFGVRCVKSIDSPSPVYTDPFERTSGDHPMVQHPATQLIWQGCVGDTYGDTCMFGTLTPMSWDRALEYCINLEWGDKTDWRLPNVQELFSITSIKADTPIYDTAILPNTPEDKQSGFWTATSNARYTALSEDAQKYAWIVQNDGQTILKIKKEKFFVTCVREPI